jgi:hypothetical protein
MANIELSWWYTMPEGHTVDPAIRHYYDSVIYRDYYPAPYVTYRGARPLAPVEGRVCLLGDSTVAAPPRLGQMLQAVLACRGVAVEVSNFGVIAANSAMMLDTLMHRLVNAWPLPAAVVIIGGGIDLITPLNFDPRPGYPHLHQVSELLFEHFYDEDRRSLWSGAEPLSPAELRRRFFDRLVDLRRQVSFKSPSWEEAIADSCLANIAKILQLGNAFQLRILYVLQPLLLFKDCKVPSEAETLPSPASIAYLTRQYRKLASALALYSEGTTPARVLDLHNLFKDSAEYLFEDIIHYNDRGREIVAAAIADAIESWLRS